MQPLHRLSEHQMQEFQLVKTIFGARCTTEFDGCGQHLWVCPVGVSCDVAMVPDGNPKKLEPMLGGHCTLVYDDWRSSYTSIVI